MFSLILAIFFCSVDSLAQEQVGQRLSETFVRQKLDDAIQQYRILIPQVPDGFFPSTYRKDDDSLGLVESKSWVSGFYPGTLLYLYEYSGNDDLLAEATKRLNLLEKEKNNTGTHDLGFMLYCSFGHALRLTGSPDYERVLLTGAESLASRYHPKAGCIRSWDTNAATDQWQFPVIIDNMMNLEMLNWASRFSGNQTYQVISERHANTTLENHFREDNSSYHVIDYDTLSGKVRHKHTHQGAHHESAWARGQAWGLYGYTMMYRDTQKESYRQQAKKIADFILNHPNLPADKVPYWDLSIAPEANTPRDASAAAITASALLELSGYVAEQEKETYEKAAEQMIFSLSQTPYSVETGACGGFILDHSTGHLPANREIDVPLSYADYYYVEALTRYLRMLQGKPIIAYPKY
ncbi:Glycosyl Hydrolase Family 88 [Parapedobacter koreensis]|uniref:Glycosyl Hydrolase Family 88 n=2 Tax=Parapedobacter koreensis TaxID=332977 RepID=A0A1H7SNE7_9SPHI|nr:Glycosyl Hydrolase Family 88 [Parapedobacter koreensis]